jgi:hypothetical protein
MKNSKKLVLILILPVVIILGYLLLQSRTAVTLESVRDSQRSEAEGGENRKIEIKAEQVFNQIGNKQEANSNGEVSGWIGSDSKVGAAYTGLSFAGVGVPENTKLINGYIQFTSRGANEANTGEMKAMMYGVRGKNITLFSKVVLPSTRERTVSAVEYTETNPWLSPQTYVTPSLLPLLQELEISDTEKRVNIIIEGIGNNDVKRYFYGSERESLAPGLVLIYE